MASETQQTTSTQSTQPRTQSTQQASQQEQEIDTTCWGRLIPCNRKVAEYKLDKTRLKYIVGRSGAVDIALPDVKISGIHCEIEWDGDETSLSAVKVVDNSRNGTFINERNIGKGQFCILRDGDEIAFGDHKPPKSGNAEHDYRFIYRRTPLIRPTEGIHKDYDTLQVLGQGSFATVMKALNKAEGKWYAVKIVHAHKLELREGWQEALEQGRANGGGSKQLLREITILQRLKHQNICELKEFFVAKEAIYLVLELVQGGDLMKYILMKEEKGQRPSEAETGHIILQICEAVAYVHSLGIAHRDLKLENVLLTKDSPPVVKVADFGLAKIVDPFTDLESTCGTSAYLAPEVAIHGPEGYSLVVDSWSVGIIAYVLLTLHIRPYLHDDPDADLKTRVTTREVNWDRLRKRGASEQWQQFLHGLLEEDPGRRTTMAQASRDPWLIAQAAAVADGTAENPLCSPRELSLPPKHASRGPTTSSPAATPPADPAWDSRVRQASTRANTEEVEQPRAGTSRRTLTRTDTVVYEDSEEDPLLSEAARAYKRKVQDRSDASITPRDDSRYSGGSGSSETTIRAPTKGDSVGKKGSRVRAPGIKRVRTGSTDATASNADDSDEVPGLVLRRSPRLNTPSS